MASLIASINERGEAVFLPAISNAVPCKGDVLIKGRPRVRFTPLSGHESFKGINAWS